MSFKLAGSCAAIFSRRCYVNDAELIVKMALSSGALSWRRCAFLFNRLSNFSARCNLTRAFHKMRTRTGNKVLFEKVHQTVSPSKRLKGTHTEDKVVLRFAKLSQNATAPSRGSTKAAGYDLYSAYDYVIPAMGKTIVKTDIQIAVPSGYYGRVAPRSGLAAKHFIDVGAGVIDEDYRGNVGVVLFNFSKDDFEVKKGDRIAQLICERICYPDLEQLETLDQTDRGDGGFGSTGTN
ncbi:deoxyuridine 5'-triphosphate nucleotidohydrolase, mitochondrial [Erpetoichthys calabaricus]|uniref:Deoxyuridine 5'-triphosphate nucleotidohydrolase n=1 Tax=Erpetoichthys calabaricus TaxID=27687 RepID=A0A8C4TFV7_ERPCA|nr:deoxyuridine 5'-triphosphate nucleotidohydrolase, mitochondrial [Erpetoichthys calabaricus]